LEVDSREEAEAIMREVGYRKKNGKFQVPKFEQWNRKQIRPVENKMVAAAKEKKVPIRGRRRYDFEAHTDAKASPYATGKKSYGRAAGRSRRGEGR
jgi:hypothetical protein